jgi:hypothetical protein
MNLKENKEDVGNEEGKKRTGNISPSTATASKKWSSALLRTPLHAHHRKCQ